MLRATEPRRVPVGVSAVNGKPGVNVALFAEPKPAARRSPGCVAAIASVAGAAELPNTLPVASTRFVAAEPAKAAALTMRGEVRPGENVTVNLVPGCSAVDTYPEPM